MLIFVDFWKSMHGFAVDILGPGVLEILSKLVGNVIFAVNFRWHERL